MLYYCMLSYKYDASISNYNRENNKAVVGNQRIWKLSFDCACLHISNLSCYISANFLLLNRALEQNYHE